MLATTMSQPVFAPVANCPKNKKKIPGVCKLLFETPSGFAIFSFDIHFLHKTIEDTWHYFVGDYWHYCFLALHAFRKFEDKSDAINLTTRQVGGRMIGLLCDYCLPGELIIVGRPEYKSVIEEKLRRACVCNDRVREIMWGMQNLMPLLIPQEQSEFTKADRLPICKGLDMLFSRHGINNVKPEWINEDILQMALKVYHADLREKEHSKFLRRSLGLDKHLKAISGFDAKDWDLVKLATALKTMVDPDGTPRLTLAEAFKMFSSEEVKLIHRDAPKYEDLLDRDTILKIYDDIVAVRDYVDKVLLKLRHLLKKAEAALETEDVLEKAATDGVDSMQQVDRTCLAVVPVEVPNQSSIDEEQECHLTRADGEEYLPDLGDSTLPTSQKNNEPITSVEGMNQENEAEKASFGEQMNTILDVVRNDLEDPAQEFSGNVPLIEEVIATNKDTPAVSTTQDVAQHANTQAQKIDAEQIINAQVKNGGMHTNNGDGERAEATDLSRGMHTNNREGDRAEATDLSMSSVDLVEVPSQSSIDEDQQHITGADGTLPSQMTNEPGTSVEGTNQENEAEKASLGEQNNTILDVVVKDLEEAAEKISGNVPLIEKVIATNKDTPAVGTTQDVAQHANTRAQEIDAEQIINALVKTRSMHTNNGEGGEQADEDITGGGEQAEVTDLSKSSERTSTEKIESIPGEGGKQAEVTGLSKSSERSSTKMIVADKGGKQAEATDLSKSLERTCTESKEIVADEDITGLADLSLSLERTSTEKKDIVGDEDLERIDPIELHAEPSRTGLHAEQSKDKKTSAKVASPVKPVPAKTKQGSVEGTVQNNDCGRKRGEGTSLLSLLSMESPEQTQTRRRSESMTLDMSESHAQDFRRRESKAVTSRSGPLAQPSRLQFMGADNPNRPVRSIDRPPASSRHQFMGGGNPEPVRSSDPLPVYQPRSIDPPPAPRSKDWKASDLPSHASGSGHPSRLPSHASGSRPPLAVGSKDEKTSTKDAASSVKAGSKDKKTSTKDARSSVKAGPPETSSADLEAVPDPSLGFHIVKKTLGLLRKHR